MLDNVLRALDDKIAEIEASREQFYRQYEKCSDALADERQEFERYKAGAYRLQELLRRYVHFMNSDDYDPMVAEHYLKGIAHRAGQSWEQW